MTEETLSQANQIMYKIRDLEKKIELINKSDTYCYKLIVRTKQTEYYKEELCIPDFLIQEFKKQILILFTSTLTNLRSELAAL